MKHCYCGSREFISEAKNLYHIVIDKDGTVRFTSLKQMPFYYVRCSECGAVYAYEDGKITVPRATLIRRICNECVSGPGLACVECEMMDYRSRYRLLRIEDYVGVWKLFKSG